MRALLVLPLAVGCSYSLDGSARSAAPPAAVSAVAAVATDAEGRWIRGSPLSPVDTAHPFLGDVEPGPDGERLWLLGYTAEQIDACTVTDGGRPETSPLRPSDGTMFDLPPAAWVVGGAWSDGATALEADVFDRPLTSDWLTGELTVCDAWRYDETVIPSPFDVGPRMVLRFADDTLRFFLGRGLVIDVDPTTLDIDPVQTTTTASTAQYIGGFVDGDDRMWLFVADGRLDRLRRGEAPEVLATDGPWRGRDVVWAAGGRATGGGDELFFFHEGGELWRYTNAAFEKLRDVPPPTNLDEHDFADLEWIGDGEVWVATDGSFDILHYVDGRLEIEPVGSPNLGAPITLTRTERYGLVTGTTGGYVLRRATPDGWSVVVSPIQNGALSGVEEWGDGLLLNTRFGYTELVLPTLPRCERIGGPPYGNAARALVGDRLVMYSRDDGMSSLYVWDLTREPIGCGIVPPVE